MELRDILTRGWKRRGIVLAVLVGTIVSSGFFALRQPERFESTADARADARRQGGAGLRGLGQPLDVARHLRRDREVLAQPAARPGDPRPQARRDDRHLDRGRHRHPADLGRAETRGRPRDGRAPPRWRSWSRSATTSCSSPRIVDPPVPERKAVQPRPPLIIVRGRPARALRRLAAGVRDRQLPSPHRHRRGRHRAHERAGGRAAPARPRARARRTHRLGVGAVRQPAGELPRAAHQPAVPDRLDPSGHRGHELRGRRRASRRWSRTSAWRSARSGSRRSSLDADLRRPRQHEIFGLDNRTGLSTAMALERTNPELQADGVPGPVGHTERADAAGSDRDAAHPLRERDRGLRELDALVLVDTPPLLPVSDARLIAPHTDGVLLVVAAGTQKPATLQRALDQLELSTPPARPDPQQGRRRPPTTDGRLLLPRPGPPVERGPRLKRT